jgi:hypothetical protein
MSSTHAGRCCGCGAGLGELHAVDCGSAVCWRCRTRRRECGCIASGEKPFPHTGDLEAVFSLQNRYDFGLGLGEFSYLPKYDNGKLVGLRANQFDPGAWHAIEASPGLTHQAGRAGQFG